MLTLVVAAPEAQSPPDARAQADTTQQQINERILSELKVIHQLLERLAATQGSAPATTWRVANLDGHALGRIDAPLTMVEFADLQCSFCRQFAMTTFGELQKNWIDTGKLRYVSRDFPLDFHAHAMPAARAVRCAGEQGKFWEMRLSLMRNADLISPEFFARMATSLGLDVKVFTACTASATFDAKIRAEATEGATLGVTGTPTFVVGKTTSAGIEGPVIVGALPYSQFDTKLRELLSR